MAQGLLTRLTHERLGVLITDSPAYKFSNEFVVELSNPSKYTDLTRIQSVQYDFSHQAIDVKAIGSDKLVTRGGSSPIVRAPDVSCSMEYFFSEGQNEIAAGFYLGRDSSVLKKYFEFVEQDDYEAYVNQHEDLINFYQKHAGLESYEITYVDTLDNILANHSKPEKTIAQASVEGTIWIYIDSEWEQMNGWQYGYRVPGTSLTAYPVNAQPKEVFGETHWFHFGRDGGYQMPKKRAPVFSDTNIIIVASSQDEIKDLNRLNEESQFEDYNVIGIGNAFLTNYSYQAAIGQFPSVSLSYQASNIKYDAYSSASKPKLPSIKRGINNLFSREDISLTRDMISDAYHGLEDEDIVFDNHPAQASVIKPGDIKVIITKTQGGRGGAKIDGLEAAVQNLSIDVPITRQDIFGMGSNYVFDRKLKLPIIANMSIDMIVRGYEQDQVNSFLTQEDVYSFTIEHSIDESAILNHLKVARTKGSNFVFGEYYYTAIDNNVWRRAYQLTDERTDVSGDFEISNDAKFLSIKLSDGQTWIKLPLVDADIDDNPAHNLQESLDGTYDASRSRMDKYSAIYVRKDFWNLNFSEEFYAQETNEADVTEAFRRVLNREGGSEGINFWSTRTHLTGVKYNMREIVAHLLGADEMESRNSCRWKKVNLYDVDNKLIFQIDRAQLKSQNYTHSVNDHVVVSNSLSFDITKNDGLKMYFDKESVEFAASEKTPVSGEGEDESGETCCGANDLYNKKPLTE